MSLTSLLSLSRFINPSYNNNFALNKAKFYYTTMVSTEVQEQQQIELTAEQQISQAEITRDSLDIVVKNRADPDIIEYKAYSHSSKSEKEHSLTATVSALSHNKVQFLKILICLSPFLIGFKRTWHDYCSSSHVLQQDIY